jgi:hypothetical protein
MTEEIDFLEKQLKDLDLIKVGCQDCGYIPNNFCYFSCLCQSNGNNLRKAKDRILSKIQKLKEMGNNMPIDN